VLEENHLPAHIFSAANTLWNYLQINQPLRKSDVAVAMGSHDLRVASHAARLVLDGWAPILICSGGYERLTRDQWQRSEAAQFFDAAVGEGLSQDKILKEDSSTNTGENLLFSKALCKKRSIPTGSVLLVHKPYMEHRVWAAAQKIWPEPQITISSSPISFNAYPTQDIPQSEVIHIMVGDFQRILEYPQKGFAVTQPVPGEVMEAFDLLVQNGFTQHLTGRCNEITGKYN